MRWWPARHGHLVLGTVVLRSSSKRWTRVFRAVGAVGGSLVGRLGERLRVGSGLDPFAQWEKILATLARGAII